MSQAKYEVVHNDKVYEVDESGFLADSEKWDLNWADYVRMEENIAKLGEEHYSVITDLRDYYREYRTSPVMRLFHKCTKLPLKRTYELFPSGPGKALKMAGLPTPFHLHQGGYYFPCGNLKIA